MHFLRYRCVIDITLPAGPSFQSVFIVCSNSSITIIVRLVIALVALDNALFCKWVVVPVQFIEIALAPFAFANTSTRHFANVICLTALLCALG